MPHQNIFFSITEIENLKLNFNIARGREYVVLHL
jgi:hypothetical protein